MITLVLMVVVEVAWMASATAALATEGRFRRMARLLFVYPVGVMYVSCFWGGLGLLQIYAASITGLLMAAILELGRLEANRAAAAEPDS